MWGGALRFTTPMLFALGFLAMFVIGGLTRRHPGRRPHRLAGQRTPISSSAHFHYVLFGGTVFALFAGDLLLVPEDDRRMLNERLGKSHFWLMFIGFNLTFFPSTCSGCWACPAGSIPTPDQGWSSLNLLASVGAFLIAISFLVLLWNFIRTMRRPAQGLADPWDAFTLQWKTSSPPAPYNS